MNIFKTLTVILFSAMNLMACGGNGKKDKDGTENKNESVSATNKGATGLEGTWEIKRAEGTMAEMNVGTIYEFKGKKLTLSLGSFKNPGTTEVTDSTFSYQPDGNEMKFTYNYHFNGDTLVTTIPNSGGQVFHLIKKQ